MTVSESLKQLAETLQEDADRVLAEAEHNPALFVLVADVIAGSVARIEKAAEQLKSIEPTITTDTLDTIAQLAAALDDSNDSSLQKKASLLDELLVTISSPKNALAESKAKGEDEINRLREEYRAKTRDDLYNDRKERLDDMSQKKAIQKGVKEQVKEYRPMEGPLQTRYCPDHPGVSTIRLGDRIYQCALDHKIYDYTVGYTTQKGNQIPGGGVEHQVSDWGHRDPGHVVFDTRQSVMGRYAATDNGLLKTAQTMGPDYQAGMEDGPSGKVIEIRVAPGTSEDRKVEIMQEIQKTMGTLYPVVFKEASFEDLFSKLGTPTLGSKWASVSQKNLVTVSCVEDGKIYYTDLSGTEHQNTLGQFVERFDPAEE